MDNIYDDPTRQLYLYIDNESDSVFSGHSITIFDSNPINGTPRLDTLIASLKGHADKKKRTIYLEEYQFVSGDKRYRGAFEKFELKFIKTGRKHFLKGNSYSDIEATIITGKPDGTVVKETGIELVPIEFSKVKQ